MEKLLGSATSLEHLGEEIAPGLYAAEVEYLIGNRSGRSPPRTSCGGRSKLGCTCRAR